MKALSKIYFKFAAAFFVLVACKHHSAAVNDCGCNSPIVQEVTNLNANLVYDTNSLIKPTQYQLITGAPGGQLDIFICDTSFAQLHAIVDTNRYITYHVIFSGSLMNFCNIDSIGWAGATPYTVKLTSLTIY